MGVIDHLKGRNPDLDLYVSLIGGLYRGPSLHDKKIIGEMLVGLLRSRFGSVARSAKYELQRSFAPGGGFPNWMRQWGPPDTREIRWWENYWGTRQAPRREMLKKSSWEIPAVVNRGASLSADTEVEMLFIAPSPMQAVGENRFVLRSSSFHVSELSEYVNVLRADELRSDPDAELMVAPVPDSISGT